MSRQHLNDAVKNGKKFWAALRVPASRADRGIDAGMRSCQVVARHQCRCSCTQAVCLSLMLYVVTLRLPPARRTVQHHRRSLNSGRLHAQYCDQHFGNAWLAKWNATAKAMCKTGPKPQSSKFTCRRNSTAAGDNLVSAFEADSFNFSCHVAGPWLMLT